MHLRCHRDAAVQAALQLTWQQEPTTWAFCEGHAAQWVQMVLVLEPYYLQIEPWGTYQPALDLYWSSAD